MNPNSKSGHGTNYNNDLSYIDYSRLKTSRRIFALSKGPFTAMHEDHKPHSKPSKKSNKPVRIKSGNAIYDDVEYFEVKIPKYRRKSASKRTETIDGVRVGMGSFQSDVSQQPPAREEQSQEELLLHLSGYHKSTSTIPIPSQEELLSQYSRCHHSRSTTVLTQAPKLRTEHYLSSLDYLYSPHEDNTQERSGSNAQSESWIDRSNSPYDEDSEIYRFACYQSFLLRTYQQTETCNHREPDGKSPASYEINKPSEGRNSATACHDLQEEQLVYANSDFSTMDHITSESNILLEGQEEKKERTMIEIRPGVKVALRGAAETLEAIEKDFFMPSYCKHCDTTIFGIQDAEYIICPACRVAAPTSENGEYWSPFDGSGGGAALGFTFDDLMAWREEIAESVR